MSARRLAAVALAVALAVVGVAACGDSTGPSPFDGRWSLQSIGGLPLPVVVGERRLAYAMGTMATARDLTDGMRLVIRGRGADTLIVRYSVAWDLDAGTDPAPIRLVDTTAVEVRGDSLCMRNVPSDDPQRCGSAPILRRRGDQLVMTFFPGPYPAQSAEYVFERESP